MLIPQYTIRRLLGLTACFAMICSIVALGVRGNAWAACVSVGMLAGAMLVAAYAALFGVVWVFSLVGAVFVRRPELRSPFRQEGAGPVGPLPDKDAPATPIILE